MFFLDQEAEYQSTIDMIDTMMRHELVEPLWYQVPLRMTNATSHRELFLHAWAEGEEWLRPKSDISIHRIDGPYPDRFYPFFTWFERQDSTPTAHVVGLRIFESMNRQRTMLKKNGYKHYGWSTACGEASYRFYPIFDWHGRDVWKYIADNELPYNRLYELEIRLDKVGPMGLSYPQRPAIPARPRTGRNPMTQDQRIQAALAILESRLRKPSRALKSPQDARNFAILQLADRKAEVFAAMFLDARHRVIEWREMFFGTIDGAAVHPREVVRAVIEVNAAAVIFVHNHPSGVAEPSEADRAITLQLQRILDIIDCRVLDHIVVGGTQTVSLAERGWI